MGQRAAPLSRIPVNPGKLTSAAGADDLDVEVADLLAQRVAVDPEQVRGADLVAARGGQSRGEKRLLHLAQDAMVEPGRRQIVAEIREIAGEMPLHRRAYRVLGASFVVRRRK